MKPNTSYLQSGIDAELLCLLILYLRNQEELYVNYHEDFIYLAHWLYLDDIEGNIEGNIEGDAKKEDRELNEYPHHLAPDICADCLATYHTPDGIHGGKVREFGCAQCRGLVPYKDKALRLIWKQRFCEILHMNYDYFDYHLARALGYIALQNPTDRDLANRDLANQRQRNES